MLAPDHPGGLAMLTTAGNITPGSCIPQTNFRIDAEGNAWLLIRRATAEVPARCTLRAYSIDPATYKATYENNVAALAKAQATLVSTRLKRDRYKELSAVNAIIRPVNELEGPPSTQGALPMTLQGV